MKCESVRYGQFTAAHARVGGQKREEKHATRSLISDSKGICILLLFARANLGLFYDHLFNRQLIAQVEVKGVTASGQAAGVERQDAAAALHAINLAGHLLA